MSDRIEFQYVTRDGRKIYIHASGTCYPPEQHEPGYWEAACVENLHVDAYTYDEPIQPIDPATLKDDWAGIEQEAAIHLLEDFEGAESDYYVDAEGA